MPQVLPMTRVEAYLAYKAGVISEAYLKPSLKTNFYSGLEHWLAYWCGLCDDYPVDENNNPKWYNEEEYYVAYLCGIAQDYPANCYRRVGAYLRHIISYRWPEPEKPLTREEYYLSLIKSTTISNPTPSSIFTLNDTTDGTFQGVEVYGDTTQNGEPTPDAPVDVNVVTGEQTVNVTGKNLFDKSDPALVFNGYLAAGAITLIDNQNDRTVFIPCQPNTEYTIQKMFSSSGKNRFRIASFATLPTNGAVGTNLSGYSQEDADTHNTASYTTSADAKYLVVFCYTADTNVSFSQMLDSIQIELGPTATEYEPYQGQSYNIDLSKNLYSIADGTYTSNGVEAVVSNGVVTVNRTSSSDTASFIRIPLAASFTAKNGDTLVIEAGNDQAIGATDNNSAYMCLRLRISGGSDDASTDCYLGAKNAVMHKTMDADKEYGVFVIRTANSLSPSNLVLRPKIYVNPIELCKIGNYQDYLWTDGEKWYKHGVIYKGVLDGTGWELASITAQRVRFGIPNAGVFKMPNMPGDTSRVYVITNFAAPISQQNSDNGALGISARNVNTLMVNLPPDTPYQTTEQWVDYLSANRPPFYSVLATPTDEEITDAALIAQLEMLAAGQSYDPLTNFTVTATDPNLPALLKVTAYKKQ